MKRRLKEKILIAVTFAAAIGVVIGFGCADSEAPLPVVWLAIALAWLAIFGQANDWFEN